MWLLESKECISKILSSDHTFQLDLTHFQNQMKYLNSLPHNPRTLGKRPFENIMGKGENAGNQHFLLFPHCFLPIPKPISILLLHFICHMQMLSF